MKKLISILFLGFFILILIFLTKQKNDQLIISGSTKLDNNYSAQYLNWIKEIDLKKINLGETKKIVQVGSAGGFEESPYYLTFEDYKIGEEIENVKAVNGNKIIYLKFRMEKRGETPSLMYDLIRYRIVGKACNLENKICYESQDKQDPPISQKTDSRIYYLFFSLPKEEKIDIIVISHLSFSGGFVGPIQTNDLPLFKLEVF